MNNEAAEVNKCDSCGKVASATIRLKRCSACKRKMYCSVKCQKQDWKDGHKDVCGTLRAFQRALDNATVRGPDDPFWVSFLDQATLENVKKLYHDEIGAWVISLDEHNNLVVKDNYEDTIVGHGLCPEKSEDILKVIYACMIMPEIDNRPRRPNSIFLGIELEQHYKHLWSEMLFIPLPIYMDNEEGREENRMRLTWPNRRWGKYAEGETFYEPQLKLRIEWLDKGQREELFGDREGGSALEFANDYLDFGYDLVNKKPRWMGGYREYKSWEDCLKDLEECGDNNEKQRSYWQAEIYDWEHDWISLEDVCVQMYGSKSVEEAAMDYVGIPRLHTNDEDADKILDRAGWVCQGYKPGRCFAMTDDSVKLGKRLLHYQGYFWEEKRAPQEYPW